MIQINHSFSGLWTSIGLAPTMPRNLTKHSQPHRRRIEMTRRRILAWFLPLALFSTAFAFAQTRSASKTTNDPDEKEWIQLFNGKDLKDWSPKITGYDLNDNFGNTFRVENGVMKVGYEKYDKFDNRFGHIFYRDKFSHYIIAVEYRFVGEQAKEGPNWATRNS